MQDDASAHGPSGLVTVAVAGREFEARAVAAVLEDAGIRAFVFPFAVLPAMATDPRRSGGGALGGKVPVQVAAADGERAKQVLDEARSLGRSLDWDEVDVGDPEPDPYPGLAPLAHGTKVLFSGRGCALPILVFLVLLPLALLLLAWLA